MKLGRAAWLTDTGRRRLRNEDAHVFEPPLFAVADGMGGARAGEVAAGIAAAALREGRSDVDGEESLEAIIVDANRRVWERSVADPNTSGMGTTVTVALVDLTEQRVVFGHVGDSRAYRLRGGALDQITTDHSLVAELVESGVLTPEEAERHPQRSAITRAVGTERAIDADVFATPAEPGDLFLICSDGLTDMLSDGEIAASILGADCDPQAAAESLVTAANANGGEDNITVVLFEVVEGEPDVAPGPAPVAVQEVTPEVESTEPIPAIDDSEPDVSHHGAGPGGRIAALAFIAAVIAIAAVALYVGISR